MKTQDSQFPLRNSDMSVTVREVVAQKPTNKAIFPGTAGIKRGRQEESTSLDTQRKEQNFVGGVCSGRPPMLRGDKSSPCQMLTDGLQKGDSN